LWLIKNIIFLILKKMKNEILIHGGNDFSYNAILVFDTDRHTSIIKFKNEHTDGRFVTKIEYAKLIREKKLKKIEENNGD